MLTNFLREVYWRGPRPPGEETILAFVTDTGDLYGYGTWKPHSVLLPDADERVLVIDIPYFGVDQRFQGETDLQGRKLARRLFRTVEERARAHEDIDAATPMNLVCDVDNERGQRFWHGLGFEDVEVLDFGEVRYTRMIRR